MGAKFSTAELLCPAGERDSGVSVATFRKTGVAVATATWIVPVDGGRVGLLTSSASGKIKRLRNNPRLTLQPSDVRGRVEADTTPVTGTVELVTAGPDFGAITSTVKDKYALMVPIMRLVDTVRHLGKGPFPYVSSPSPPNAAGGGCACCPRPGPPITATTWPRHPTESSGRC